MQKGKPAFVAAPLFLHGIGMKTWTGVFFSYWPHKVWKKSQKRKGDPYAPTGVSLLFAVGFDVILQLFVTPFSR
ncbi:hypothetical protein ABMB67_002087 [Halalkalibacter oceani]